jgi:hypothetical protein
MEIVRDQLGHSSLAVTERYAHLYPGALEGIAARLHSARGAVEGLGQDDEAA